MLCALAVCFKEVVEDFNAELSHAGVIHFFAPRFVFARELERMLGLVPVRSSCTISGVIVTASPSTARLIAFRSILLEPSFASRHERYPAVEFCAENLVAFL